MTSPRRTHLTLAAVAAAVTIAVAGLLPTGTASATHEDVRGESSRLRKELRAYQDAYAELQDGLDRVDQVAGQLRDRRAQRKLERIVERTRERAAKHVDDLDVERQRTLSAAELKDVLARMDDIAFSDDQLEYAIAVGASYWFTVDQLVTLIKKVSFEDSRIEIAARLSDRIVDPENWYRIESAFTYSSSMDKLRKRLAK